MIKGTRCYAIFVCTPGLTQHLQATASHVLDTFSRDVGGCLHFDRDPLLFICKYFDLPNGLPFEIRCVASALDTMPSVLSYQPAANANSSCTYQQSNTLAFLRSLTESVLGGMDGRIETSYERLRGCMPAL